MAIFSYQVTTTYCAASGTIEAADIDSAKTALTEQYGGQGFVDKDGNPLTNEIISIDVQGVQ